MVHNVKIILYPTNETEFISNGIGNLDDAVSCSVHEEINGEYELTMEYPLNGRRFEDLILDRVIGVKPNPYASMQPFRIYNITTPDNGSVTVSAHHISYDLTGYIAAPFNAESLTEMISMLNAQMQKPFNADKPPFEFKTTKDNEVVPITSFVPCNIRSLLGGTESSILDVFDGEYEWDKRTVTLCSKRGNDNGIRIAYGKNLTSLEQDINCENVWSGIYPYWYAEEVVTEEDGTTWTDRKLVELSEDDNGKVINFEGDYSNKRIYILDLSSEFDGAPTPEELREKANEYIELNDYGTPKVNLKVSFVDLSKSSNYSDFQLLERVKLGDMVTVEFPKLRVNAKAEVISTTYDVLIDRYSEIELGEMQATLAGTIVDKDYDRQKAERELEEDTRSFLEKAIDRATDLINGGLGGYAMFHSSSGGKIPDELLIMDTPDINTAQKIWRWNMNGLGYSSNGYVGPFGLAMTMDGAIVASYITTGDLNAKVLTAGIIKDKNGKCSWDLDTGVFKITGSNLNEAITEIRGDVSGISTRVSKVERKFDDYSTTTEMEAVIDVKANEINESVKRVETSLGDRPTKTEMEGAINVKAGEISLEVAGVRDDVANVRGELSLKVGRDENNQIASMLSASANEINIQGDRFILNTTNFTVEKNGTIHARNGEFSGAITSSGTREDGPHRIYINDSYLRVYRGESEIGLEISPYDFKYGGTILSVNRNDYSTVISGDTIYVGLGDAASLNGGIWAKNISAAETINEGGQTLGTKYFPRKGITYGHATVNNGAAAGVMGTAHIRFDYTFSHQPVVIAVPYATQSNFFTNFCVGKIDTDGFDFVYTRTGTGDTHVMWIAIDPTI